MRKGQKTRKRSQGKKLTRIAAGFFVLVLLAVGFAGGYHLAERKKALAEKEQQEEKKKRGTGKKETQEEKAEAQKPVLTEEEKRELEIDELLENMSLEDKASQLFFVRPEALTGVGTAVQAGEMTRDAMQSYPVGGVILFSENIEEEQQLRTMLANFHSYSRYPLFTGVDEEGGTLVARVANSGMVAVPLFPNMQEIGNSGQPEKAYEVGASIGGYLQELGFNVDFAPVADVMTNPANTVIGERSFGSDAGLVSQMVSQEVRGMQEQKVSAVLKHFPGHGDTSEDSHTESAVLNKTADELRAVEFLPFQAGIEAGADMVMVGHISVPQITGDSTPATLSGTIITEYLRGELGYDGIVITDSMSMGAIVNYYDPNQAAVQVLQAGGDMILMPQDFFAARQAVLDAVADQTLTEERLDESLRRIYRVKLK